MAIDQTNLTTANIMADCNGSFTGSFVPTNEYDNNGNINKDGNRNSHNRKRIN